MQTNDILVKYITLKSAVSTTLSSNANDVAAESTLSICTPVQSSVALTLLQNCGLHLE